MCVICEEIIKNCERSEPGSSRLTCAATNLCSRRYVILGGSMGRAAGDGYLLGERTKERARGNGRRSLNRGRGLRSVNGGRNDASPLVRECYSVDRRGRWRPGGGWMYCRWRERWCLERRGLWMRTTVTPWGADDEVCTATRKEPR